MLNRFLLLTIGALLCSCTDVADPKPYGALPSQLQLEWQKMEMYGFIHFGINSFIDTEWGYGDKDPKIFNPTKLDCRQWAKECKDAGLKGLIITAKHHDGFCLWPSKYTEYSVKNSPWRDGKGDLVQEMSEACKEYGLKLGIYLSPWDRNHANYGKPEYITYFRNQLTELLTNYGDVFEVWFDGANGGDGYYGGARETRKIDRKTYYDWPSVHKLVRKLQPNAVLFSDAGPDCRWCGNEKGYLGEQNWSTINSAEFWPGLANKEELNSGHEDGTDWIPAEADVSIRPSWFYRPAENNRVHPISKLVDIYYHSVGRNSTLLLNFPVDNRGLIHENDVKNLRGMASVIKSDFANNLALDIDIDATNTRGRAKKFSTSKLIDGDFDTYWTTDDGVLKASIELNLSTEPIEVNRVLIQEYIPLGQRVKAFTVEAFVGNDWKLIDTQTTIGYKRILRFPTVLATKIRINILKSKAEPTINNIELYHALDF